MRLTTPGSVLVLGLLAGGCQRNTTGNTTAPPPPAKRLGHGPQVAQVPPPPDVAAPPAEAMTTPSGVAYRRLVAGDGNAAPRPWDAVTARYTVWNTDGVTLESVTEPVTFPVANVIPGWAEGLARMSIGDTYRLWVPEALAFAGHPDAPEGMLVIDLHLDAIDRRDPPPPPRTDLRTPPADAVRTASGAAVVWLAHGKRAARPRRWDRVALELAAWAPDGTPIPDVAASTAAPARFVVEQAPGSWADVLVDMAAGDRVRLWDADGVYELGLVAITRMPDPPRPPRDVATPPASARRTDEGAPYRILARGRGARVQPAPGAAVTLAYRVWSAAGELVDTAPRRRARLPELSPQLASVVRAMSPGDRARAWVTPDDGDRLTYDVELVGIEQDHLAPLQ